MTPVRCLTSFNRFQLPSSEATPLLSQFHKGNMPRSWLRDTDIQNGDALFCFIIIITVIYIVELPYELRSRVVRYQKIKLNPREKKAKKILQL